MRKWISSCWENYKYRFVPWIIVNLKQKKKMDVVASPQNSDSEGVPASAQISQTKPKRNLEIEVPSSGSMIIDHVRQGDDKLLSDQVLVNLLLVFFEKLLEFEKENALQGVQNANEIAERTKKLMHSVFGYSVERRRSLVGEHAGTGVFLASGVAKPGSLIALYPGTIYMPSEPLFFQSLGNPFIFRCSDNVHIDGNDKWISRSVYRSCAARDRFSLDLPCCDESWLTPTPMNPINIGQYVNNRSKTQKNNVVYQESQLVFGSESSSNPTVVRFPIRLCKYLPNVWTNPDNNHFPIRVVPLVAVKEIKEGDEILSSYFTVVHADKKSQNSTKDIS